MSRVKKAASQAKLKPDNVETVPFAQGPLREYRKTTPSKQLAVDRALSAEKDGYWLGILSVFAVFVRYYNLSQPGSVVFDEVHFGGFARKYIIGRFFMDVHPPLAKMLYAVFGWISGYDGELTSVRLVWNTTSMACLMLP
jgi:dolichyl-phosphate-mannose-protein mannosyltransferase